MSTRVAMALPLTPVCADERCYGSSLNVRLELLERLTAISGCTPGELPVLDGKVRSLSRETDPDAQERRPLRVLELAELPEPDLTASPAIDVDELLKARDLPEARVHHVARRREKGESGTGPIRGGLWPARGEKAAVRAEK